MLHPVLLSVWGHLPVFSPVDTVRLRASELVEAGRQALMLAWMGLVEAGFDVGLHGPRGVPLSACVPVFMPVQVRRNPRAPRSPPTRLQIAPCALHGCHGLPAVCIILCCMGAG
jgi:hypothetical protein